jgi:PleD family two-component response regulator
LAAAGDVSAEEGLVVLSWIYRKGVDDDAMIADKRALILIVDDFLEIHRLLLERTGYWVVTAADAAQALAKMELEAPDLVIADLMMASLDSGFSLAQNLKTDARYSVIPVIMSTSVSSALGMDFRPLHRDPA